jgi:glycosyltransferase involved in cell wall biosynthesis
LRIVRVSEYVAPSPGGREVHVRELSRRQADGGYHVRLLYRVGGEPDWSFESTRLLGLALLWRHVPRRLRTLAFLAASLGIVAKNRRSTDLVHFHGDYLETIAAGVVRLMGVPALLTLHGRLSPRVLRTVGRIYRLPSHVVAVSSPIAAQLESVGLPRRRITVQHSGVDAELFHPPEQRPPAPPFRVIVGSTLIPLKDHGSLIEAVRLLQADSVDVRLDIAGAGPERARLEGAAPTGVHFHGQLDRPDLARLMRGSHAAALASIDTAQAGEGTPTFLMEAIACGLPFVATDAGGVPELASRSGAGVIVPQKRPDTLAAALKALATDDAPYDRLRSAALAFGPSLDWDRVAKRLDSVVEQLVGAQASSVGLGTREDDVVGE